jgi:hypothetical protein
MAAIFAPPFPWIALKPKYAPTAPIAYVAIMRILDGIGLIFVSDI